LEAAVQRSGTLHAHGRKKTPQGNPRAASGPSSGVRRSAPVVEGALVPARSRLATTSSSKAPSARKRDCAPIDRSSRSAAQGRGGSSANPARDEAQGAVSARRRGEEQAAKEHEAPQRVDLIPRVTLAGQEGLKGGPGAPSAGPFSRRLEEAPGAGAGNHTTAIPLWLDGAEGVRRPLPSSPWRPPPDEVKRAVGSKSYGRAPPRPARTHPNGANGQHSSAEAGARRGRRDLGARRDQGQAGDHPPRRST